MAKSKKQLVDYDRMEPLWKAGVLSVRQIAEQYEKSTGIAVSHVAIMRHFKSRGIERNLTQKILEKTDQKLQASLITKDVTNSVTNRLTREQNAAIVDSVSDVLTEIVLSHRSEIATLKRISSKFARELEQCNDADYNLPTRVKVIRDATSTLKELITLERQAYKMDEVKEEKQAEQIIVDIRAKEVTDDELLASIRRLEETVGIAA